MKVVIDIPDKVFENLLVGKVQYGGVTARRIFNAVKKGTPLPQGHGRLIDADVFTASLEDYHVTAYSEYDEGRNQMLAWIREDILDAPTIIEADKGEGE